MQSVHCPLLKNPMPPTRAATSTSRVRKKPNREHFLLWTILRHSKCRYNIKSSGFRESVLIAVIHNPISGLFSGLYTHTPQAESKKKTDSTALFKCGSLLASCSSTYHSTPRPRGRAFSGCAGCFNYSLPLPPIAKRDPETSLLYIYFNSLVSLLL